MTSRQTGTARKCFSLLGFSFALAVASNAALAAGNGLPVPVPPLPIGIPGGGGGPGGGGPGGGGPGGGGPGGGSGGPGGPGLIGSPSALGFQLAGTSSGNDVRTINGGPDDRFGDPLSTDLLGNDRVHARLRYYGESGAVGTTQAVGINLTFAQ